MLLILDVVWTAEQCNPFLEISAKLSGTSLLITARRTNVVQGQATTQLDMNRLSGEESATLILDMTTPNRFDQEGMRREAGFGEVLAKCDGLPALLRAFGRLCNRNSCSEVLKDWADVPQTHASLEYGSLFTAYKLQLNNLKLCDEELLTCLEKLAILREADDVSLDALEHVWPGTDVKDTVERLIAQSIIEGTQWVDCRVIRLIDAWLDFLRVHAGEQKMAGWHAELLRRCGRMVGFSDGFLGFTPFIHPRRLTFGSTNTPTHVEYFAGGESLDGSHRFVHHMLGAARGAFAASGSIEFGDLSHLEQLNLSGSLALTEVPQEIMIGMRSLRILDMSFCSKLVSIKLPPSIADFRFFFCESLREVELPDRLTHIGKQSFVRCNSLERVQLPRRIQSIGDLAFKYCSLNTVFLPESVQTIGDECFEGCSSLRTVEFEPSSRLQRIGESAFYACTSLESIALPSDLVSIGKLAFAECLGLTTVDLPIRIEASGFGQSVFQGCGSLTKVTRGGEDRSDLDAFVAELMRGDDSVSDHDGLSDAADDYIYEDYIYDSDNGGGPS